MSTAQRTFSDNDRPDVQVLHIAKAQAGVVSRAQLLGAGLSNQQIHRRCLAGSINRMLPTVYRLASAPEIWEQRLWAAQLWAGPGAGLSHQAAAALWELDGCERDKISLITTRSLKSPLSGMDVRRVAAIPPHHLTMRGGLRVTTPTRTILDLAGVVSEEALEAALDCALRRGSTSIPRLDAELRRTQGSGRRGARTLRSLIQERSAGYSPTHSVLEARFRRLLKRAQLPLPSQQHVVRRQHRGFARVDFHFPAQALVIEVDGYAHHASRRSWQDDLARQNDLVVAGLKVLRYTWRDICTREAAITATLRSFFIPPLPLSGS